MKAIAIVPARGGSKRIPGKNKKLFCGKPIITYGIGAALESGLFDEVMVSTDDEEIARIARDCGASVPFMRSEKTSNDYAIIADVLDEVLERYAQMGEHYDLICCIYPTAPFVTAQKLCDAVTKLSESNADSLLPVVRFGFPPQRAVVIRDGFLRFQYPENEKKRSQDLEPIYHDCGQFFFCKTEAFLRYHTPITPNTVPLVVSEEEVQDVDTPTDWALAETKYKTFIV